MNKIEIELNDFREINDKIGGIKSAALLAKMSADNERVDHLNDIISWAQEITFGLNNGAVMPEGNNESAAIIVVLQKEIQRLEGEVQDKITFNQEYELALKEGNKRFGSLCKHENVKNGICKDCLRTVIVRGIK